MKTSYEGCNKEIAKSLKRGEHIKCYIGSKVHTRKVIAYVCKDVYPYKCSSDTCFKVAEPIKTETYVIDAVSMLKGLIERGWEQQSDGNWRQPNGLVFVSTIFFECENVPLDQSGYHDWMLEEKEVE